MRIEARLRELGLVLPEPVKPPPGVRLPFAPVRVIGDRALVSGHGPQHPDGSIAGPFGKVGADVTIEQGYQAARLTALSMRAALAAIELYSRVDRQGDRDLRWRGPVEVTRSLR